MIEEEMEAEFPWRRVIKLTEKGAQVAEKLEEIHVLLEDKNNAVGK